MAAGSGIGGMGGLLGPTGVYGLPDGAALPGVVEDLQNAVNRLSDLLRNGSLAFRHPNLSALLAPSGSAQRVATQQREGGVEMSVQGVSMSGVIPAIERPTVSDPAMLLALLAKQLEQIDKGMQVIMNDLQSKMARTQELNRRIQVLNKAKRNLKDGRLNSEEFSPDEMKILIEEGFIRNAEEVYGYLRNKVENGALDEDEAKRYWQEFKEAGDLYAKRNGITPEDSDFGSDRIEGQSFDLESDFGETDYEIGKLGSGNDDKEAAKNYLDTAINSLNSQISSINSNKELQMIALNDYLQRRSTWIQMVSSMVKKHNDTLASIVAKIS